MRNPIFKAHFTLTMILGALALPDAVSSAGIIDLLRGEGEPEPARQRVAFVGAAEVRSVEGMVERLTGIERWERLESGAELRPGDLVRTGEGTVVLRMTESESFVKVTPYTVLRLVQNDERWDASVLTGRREQKGYVVRGCRGEAYFRKSGGAWEPVTVNSVLATGAELRTESGTTVDLYDTEAKRTVRLPGSAEMILGETGLAGGRVAQPTLARAGGK